MTTDATAYISSLWLRFVPHFGLDHLLEDRLMAIPDEGMIFEMGGEQIYALPAHFLHSVGNMQIYDPVSKILYTGDLGAALGVDPAKIPVVTRDQVKYAKPDPDLFLAAAARLGVPIESAIVVGDSIWDMLAAMRCRALGVGLLSGGYGQDELERSGAMRVYEDPQDMLKHLDEVGGRR